MAEQVRGLNEMLARFQVGVGEIAAMTAMAPTTAVRDAQSASRSAARMERRGANRPWTARTPGKAAKQKPRTEAVPMAVPGGGAPSPAVPAARSPPESARPVAATARGNGTLGTGDAGDSEWQEF